MKIHHATEQAYKNGYEQGVKDFAERLKLRFIAASLQEAINETLTELTEKGR